MKYDMTSGLLENALRYIERDLITRQKNGRLMKFSRPLNGIAYMDLSTDSYTKFWFNSHNYSRTSKEVEELRKACEYKFNNGLISNEEMLRLIENGNVTEDEYVEAIKRLNVKVK